MIKRRTFAIGAAGTALLALAAFLTMGKYGKAKPGQSNADLKIWLSGDAHLKQSVEVYDYNCLKQAITDIDEIGFDYDLALNVGDFDSAQAPPTWDSNDNEGVLVVDALTSSKLHDRAEIYCINGNHDAGNGEMDWFEKYIDVLGVNKEFSKHDVSRQPYPITLMEEGAWHSYYITVGNLTIFMLSDRNSLPGPFGRGGMTQGKGGYPAGTISKKTWEWFQAYVLANKDRNIFVCSHQGVRNTVMATVDGDGKLFHGKTGFPDGGGSIYSIYDEDEPEKSVSGTDVIKDFFAANPDHSVSLWLSGHTHTRVGDTWQGRGIRHNEHGIEFLNVCALTTSWIGARYGLLDSRSWTCEVTGRDVRLRCYVHRPIQEEIEIGFQDPLEFSIELPFPFQPAEPA